MIGDLSILRRLNEHLEERIKDQALIITLLRTDNNDKNFPNLGQTTAWQQRERSKNVSVGASNSHSHYNNNQRREHIRPPHKHNNTKEKDNVIATNMKEAENTSKTNTNRNNNVNANKDGKRDTTRGQVSTRPGNASSPGEIKNVNNNKHVTLFGKNNTTKLQGVERKHWPFVSRLLHTTTTKDVTELLKSNDIENVDCVRLDIQSENIAAFKLGVPEKDVDKVYNENLWPTNTIIRNYNNRNFYKASQIIQRR